MKKLSLILLVIGFALGFAGQVRAEFTPNLDKDAFAVDEEITFNELAGDINCQAGQYVPIANQYDAQYGVRFSGVVFPERQWGPYFIPDPTTLYPVTAVNFNPCTLGDELDTYAEPITVLFDPAVTRVGFDGFSYGGKITVTAFRDEAAMGSVTHDTSVVTFIGIEETEGIEAIQIEATGYVPVKWNTFFIDNLTFGGTPETGQTETEVKVKVNIKPPNCLDARIPFNVKSKGVTPVVIIGDPEMYEVTNINPDTVLLQGVKPERWAIENASHCGAVDGDGTLDLTLKFDTEKLLDGIKNSLGEDETLEDGDMVPLSLTGNLFLDDTPIRDDGGLFVTIIMTGKHQHENRGRGPHPLEHDRGKHKGWDKNR